MNTHTEEQLNHHLNIRERILDYMDELDSMTRDVEPSVVRYRLRMILERAGDAAFEQYSRLPVVSD